MCDALNVALKSKDFSDIKSEIMSGRMVNAYCSVLEGVHVIPILIIHSTIFLKKVMYFSMKSIGMVS